MDTNILIEENMGLAYSRAIYFSKVFKNILHEDILQVCFLGLIKAAKDFDDSKKVKFSTYAYHKIYGEVMNFIRDTGWFSGKREGKNLINVSSLNCKLEDGQEKIEFIQDADDDYTISELKLIIKQVLTKREVYIFIATSYYNLSQRHVAERLGISQITVSRERKRAVDKLKEALVYK